MLASHGCRVILTSRSLDAGKSVARDISASGFKGPVDAVQLDLADLAAVRRGAQQIHEMAPRIDYVILNAGVMGCEKSYTADGFEMQLGTNHIGHWAFIAGDNGLLPHLKAQDTPMRIVVVSSKGHYLQRSNMNFEDLHYERRSYGRMSAYAQSKLATVLFAKQLATDLKGTHISVFSVHPGSIKTNLVRHWAPNGSWLDWLVDWVFRLIPWREFKPISRGVSTTIYAALSTDLEGRSGAYLSDCREEKPSRPARDPTQAEKLWETTAAQVAEAQTGKFVR